MAENPSKLHQNSAPPAATKVSKDSSKKSVDSLALKEKKQKDGIKTSVKYASEDSIIFDAEKQTMKLFGKSKIDYGEMSLKAEQIDINWLNNNVEAHGVADSAGNLKGTPVFKEKEDQYQTKRIVYNFKTKKGIISEVVTKQGDGYIHGEKVKKNEDNELFANHSKYTTCNLANPHYYIASSKIKMIPEKKVLSGPFHFVINKVPLPVGFLFGMFPIPKNRSSGIIVPTYGESQNQGFFLQQGGFYWAVSPYLGMRFLGDIYSLGGAGSRQITEYRKRYAFEGNLNFTYRWVVIQNTLDPAKNINQHAFWVNWRHSTLSKKLGRLSANVDAGTANFNQINIQNTNPNVVLTPAFQSNVQYSQSFRNSPISLGVALRQNQNTTGVKTFTLPDLNFAMNRVMPFQKIQGKNTEAIRKLNLSYNMNMQNVITNDPAVVGQKSLGKDSILLPNGTYQTKRNYNFSEDADYLLNSKNFNNGIRHSIPISTSIKVMKYFSLNPTMSYDEFWYSKYYDYKIDTANGKQIVKRDTVQGFARANQYSMGTSLTTRIYGTFFLRTGRVEAIRHTLIPNISYSYRPDFSENQFGYFENLTVNGQKQVLNKFQGLGLGSPSPGKSSLLGFSLNNTFEMKVKQNKDSSDAKKKFKKVSLLDNLSMAGNYNLAADSFNLSNIAFAARTKLFGLFDIAYNATVDPYVRTNVAGTLANSLVSKRVNQFQWEKGKGLGNILNSNLAFGFALSSQSFKKTNKPDAKERSSGIQPMSVQEQMLHDIRNNPNKYLDFTIPWSFNLSYNLTYIQLYVPTKAPDLYTHSITYNGDISLSSKWKIQFNSGYNLTQKLITYTRFGITRDLHCWVMSLNWIPPLPGTVNTGQYNFQLNVKSSVLQDLKLTRNRFWVDQ